MKNLKFLVIGERCLDRFKYGNCDRLCPEAPVPVFVPTTTVNSVGMAANVSKNLQSIIESRANKFEVLDIFSNRFSVKTRYVDARSNHIFLRIDEGDSNYKCININNSILKKIRSSDVILISDYDKGYLDIPSIVQMLKIKKKDTKVIMDTKKIINAELAENVDYFKLNSLEYKNNFNKVPDLLNIYKEKIIVTKGSQGTDYLNVNYPVEVKQTIDVSGAGDTFLAALGYYLGIGKKIEECIIFANEMASQVVTKRGITTI
jgi:D-beta-D-heptose 7-phosphate kinase/D-beta-D-heptose 1-phosphate adenosyltransferase